MFISSLLLLKTGEKSGVYEGKIGNLALAILIDCINVVSGPLATQAPLCKRTGG